MKILRRREAVKVIRTAAIAYLLATHVPSIALLVYTHLLINGSETRCDVLLVIAANVSMSELEDVLPRNVSVCIARPTIFNYTALSYYRARIALLIAHGSRGYLSTNSPANALAVYLAVLPLELGLYAVMDTPDGSLMAVRYDILLRYVDAKRIVAVTCTNIDDPRIALHVRRIEDLDPDALRYDK